MNKFSDDLLAIDSFGASLTVAQYLLVPSREVQFETNTKWLEQAFHMIQDTGIEVFNVWDTFTCFLATFSNEDLIEMNFAPKESF